mmetsp:Transcript_36333/g.95809  ORF Transcript_36333/g.95809 Transcript_36333/m.95809 type:complete len:214 (-) Transcript_36333:1156-1797(-)
MHGARHHLPEHALLSPKVRLLGMLPSSPAPFRASPAAPNIERRHGLRLRGDGADVGPQDELLWDLLEARRLGVELGRLDKLKEEVCYPLAQSFEGVLRAAAVEHIGLAVDQLDDVAGQVAVKLLDSPLDVEEDVEALVDGQQRQTQSVVELHQLLGARRERRVHLRNLSVGHLPPLGRRHELEGGADALVAVLVAGLQLEPVDRLQQFLLLEQ